MFCEPSLPLVPVVTLRERAAVAGGDVEQHVADGGRTGAFDGLTVEVQNRAFDFEAARNARTGDDDGIEVFLLLAAVLGERGASDGRTGRARDREGVIARCRKVGFTRSFFSPKLSFPHGT